MSIECFVVAHSVGPAGLSEAGRLQTIEEPQPALEAIGADFELGVRRQLVGSLNMERLKRRLGQLEANAILPAGLAVERTRRHAEVSISIARCAADADPGNSN